MEYLTVPNLAKWQHYKDRCPPWIKMHRELLTDYEFTSLDDAEKSHLMLIWLLASQMDNSIPFDAEWIGKKISANSPVNIQGLVSKGFIEITTAKNEEKQGSGQSRYVSKKNRALLLEKAKNQCEYCGDKENLEVDHIIPVSIGGSNEIENLQILCRKCNRTKRTKLSEHVAVSVRSKLLQQRGDCRSRETEAETETETELLTKEKYFIKGNTKEKTPFDDSCKIDMTTGEVRQ